MSWELENILWPTVYLLLAIAAIFFTVAIILYNKNSKSSTWKENLTVAAFCLVGAFLMVIIQSVGLQLSYTARTGLVSVILTFYAYFCYRRGKNNRREK